MAAQHRIIIFLLLASACSVYAQIPAVCTDEASLRDLTCCPVTSNGECGVDAGRGVCANLDLPDHSNTTTNVRDNWPHYYIRTCQCSGNFWGVDCSRCKFGYYGANCDSFQVLPRPSVADFTDSDWAEYNRILGLTRTQPSGYVAVLEETYPGNTTLRTSPLSFYEMYIWVHSYSAKDAFRISGILDYAHFAPGFNTWHRLHSLWLEWEIQNMLKAMGEADYHMFRLPVWDWRQEYQKTTGLGADELFVANRAGTTRNVSGRAVVTGDLYGPEGWETLCWNIHEQICDPTEDTGLLQRCPFTGTDPCSTDNPDWPTQAMVDSQINSANYDEPPYDITTVGGFRAIIDFEINTLSHSECANERQCHCFPSFDPFCSDTTEITRLAGIHTLGHSIMGLGDFTFITDTSKHGPLIDFAGSPNDPMFILHHNMLDCVLQGWMNTHPNGRYPDGVETPGHARYGFVIPFFPLFTHDEMFQMIEDFGYNCDTIPGIPGSAPITKMSASLLLMTGLLALLMNYIV